MKRAILFAVLFLLILEGVQAVSSDLKDSYLPRETAIGEISGGILGTIDREQISLLRDGHIDTAMEFDVGKIGSKNYIWFITPQNPGSYTLKIEDLVATVNGIPQVVNYEKTFLVAGASDYSINPGFVIASSNFKIIAVSYGDSSQNIELDFPTSRQVILYPGTNYIDFDIQNILGVQDKTIKVGKYSVPARIVGKEYICGDGLISSIEKCDGANLNGQSCTTIAGGFVGGNLTCSTNCLSFNTAGCTLPGTVCGANNLNLCLNQSACTNVGGFWYNNTCNKYEQGAVCDSSHVSLCTTQGTCLDANGYWYNNSCNALPASTCDSNHKEICSTAGTCLDAQGFWYNNSCHSNAELVCGDSMINGSEVCDCGGNSCTSAELGFNNCTTLSQSYSGGELFCGNNCLSFNTSSCELKDSEQQNNFRIDPRSITGTFPISAGLPSYGFRIVNRGGNEIKNLVLDYDRNRFSITPSYNVSIGANETAYFNLTFNSRFANYAQGVVVAYSGDIYEYLVFSVNFTTDNKTSTEYGRDRNSKALYSCAELGWKFCGSGETCESTTVETLDGDDCCTYGQCVSASSGSNAWIGYLLAGIAVLVLLIIFVKYRKTKSGGHGLKERVSMVEKNLP